MYSGKEISELVGYTSRVYGLLSALHMLDTDNYPVVERPTHLPEDQVSLRMGKKSRLRPAYACPASHST